MPWDDEPDDLPTRAELARDLLLRVMRDFAEEVCASWLVDQEFKLWEAASQGHFREPNGIAGPRVDFCKRLGDLATLAGGWWALPDSVGREGREPIFLTVDEFHPFYAAWQKAHLAER